MSRVPLEQQLSSQEVIDTTRQLNFGTWRFQKNWAPLHIVDAQGCDFIDSNRIKPTFDNAPNSCKSPGSIDKVELS